MLDTIHPPARAPVAAATDLLLRVRGMVQGVGFRPFVRRSAAALGLRGWIRNDSDGVLIRMVGPRAAVAELVRQLRAEAPAAAHVEEMEACAPFALEPAPGEMFSILASEEGDRPVATDVPPDLALCPACRGEMADPGDRRHRYPFINCTQCGPRYSILLRLPYDRPHTSMREFPMCAACAAEYADPADRRYHAQPIACPQCGPAIFLTLVTGAEVPGEAGLAEAVRLLRCGGILAVKGIGGYHLMADATREDAVAELRRRKGRDAKPLAVMFPNLAAAGKAVELTPEAEALLLSQAAPIVLLPRRAEAGLAAAIAPGNPWIGTLLPYAPLQVLLLEAFGGALVATSANLSEEPLCHDNHDAQRRLAGIADAFLEHNRRIVHPVDDSVVRLAPGGPIRLRRARGYAPSTLRLPTELAGTWLCAGAQMKATLAVASGHRVIVSPHVGDLGSLASRRAYAHTAETLAELNGAHFTAVACDLHPDYASTRFATELGLPRVSVQHHLAHVLACLLEHRERPEGVLGVAWDGTGYGVDGTIWGGEFLLLEKGEASRFARLRPFRLPGGEAAIRDARRTALALARTISHPGYEELGERLGLAATAHALGHMLEHGLNSPVTTSAGRLFDAAAVLLGLGTENHYEGQLPLALEAAALRATGADALPCPVRAVPAGGGAVCELDWAPLVDAILSARAAGRDAGELAASFHRGLADGIVAVARRAGVGTVALSGGCFQNARLLGETSRALATAGFRVLSHRELPPNDGNIAAGQALAVLTGLNSVHLP